MINDRMPEYCVERIADILNSEKKPLNGSKVLALGVAYKSDVDDYRESPAIKVIELLKKKGTFVEFYDPHIVKYQFRGVQNKGLVSLENTRISSYDLVVVLTGHTNVDYETVCNKAKHVFDTRNACRNVKNRHNIILL